VYHSSAVVEAAHLKVAAGLVALLITVAMATTGMENRLPLARQPWPLAATQYASPHHLVAPRVVQPSRNAKRQLLVPSTP